MGTAYVGASALTLLAVVCGQLSVRGAELVERSQQISVISNTPSSEPVGQTIIPRWADGNGPPAGRLMGGVYSATQQTQTLAVPAVIITEDYGQKIAQWQGGTVLPDHRPAVLSPVVRDVTIAGRPEDERATGSLARMRDQPDSYHGLFTSCNGGLFEQIRIHGIPGTAARFGRPINPRKGLIQLYDRTRLRIAGLSVSSCHRGIDNSAVDSSIYHCEANNCRDYGIRIGATQHFGDLHAWNCGVGIQIDSTGSQGGEVYGDNCGTGLLIEGWHTTLTGYWSIGCWHAAATINGTQNKLIGFGVRDAPVTINGQRNTLVDGKIETSGKADCLNLVNGTGQIVRDVTLSPGDGRWGIVTTGALNYTTIDVHVYGGAGGLDLRALGRANTIRLSTSGGCREPLRLPPEWDESNEITVNGKPVERHDGE